jgi:hypothetical protein
MEIDHLLGFAWKKKDTFASDLKKIMHLLLSGKKEESDRRGPCPSDRAYALTVRPSLQAREEDTVTRLQRYDEFPLTQRDHLWLISPVSFVDRNYQRYLARSNCISNAFCWQNECEQR